MRFRIPSALAGPIEISVFTYNQCSHPESPISKIKVSTSRKRAVWSYLEDGAIREVSSIRSCSIKIRVGTLNERDKPRISTVRAVETRRSA